MASKKSSRKSRKKALVAQRSQATVKKQNAGAIHGDETIVAQNSAKTPDTSEDSTADKQLAVQQDVEPAKKPDLPTPSPTEGLTPAVSIPEPRKQLWALGAALVIMVVLVGSLVWVVADRNAEPDTAAQGQSTNVAEIEKMLEGKSSAAMLNCVAQTSQGLGPQNAGSQLQSVPVNTLQTPQPISNQRNQPGGAQSLQPAGCFQ